MLTGLFWGAVDSFAGLSDGFYYIFIGESTSKVDKFDNLRSMKILNMSLTQKSPGIHTKRPEQEQTLQTKKSVISRAWRMSTDSLALRFPHTQRVCGIPHTHFQFSVWYLVPNTLSLEFWGVCGTL